ncbi:hypothetical protein [Actinosynnema sp. NPDC020468]|uniref:hypothetical protein n=1 Tax=Actinosynnema sp. NPDC020468 TaxID=3154488 RepID=UPI0033D98BC0
MTALVRYLLSDVLRTQRFLPPLLLFGAVLGMLYSSDAGPALGAYSGTCALVYPVGVWLTVVIATAEDPVRRSITVVASGGWGRTQSAVTLLAAAGVLGVAVIATLVPLVTQSRPYPPEVVGQGFAGLLVCGLAGVGVGVLCSRPVVPQPGWSALAALALVVLGYVLGRVPPVGMVLGALGDGRGDVWGKIALSGGCAVLLVVAATLVARTLGPRGG